MPQDPWLLLGRRGQVPVDHAGALRIAAVAAALALGGLALALFGVGVLLRGSRNGIIPVVAGLGPGLLATEIAWYWRRGRERARATADRQAGG